MSGAAAMGLCRRISAEAGYDETEWQAGDDDRQEGGPHFMFLGGMAHMGLLSMDRTGSRFHAIGYHTQWQVSWVANRI